MVVRLLVELPQRPHLRTDVLRQAAGAAVVDLDEVAGRVAHVELHDVAGQLDQAAAERLVFERATASVNPRVHERIVQAGATPTPTEEEPTDGEPQD